MTKSKFLSIKEVAPSDLVKKEDNEQNTLLAIKKNKFLQSYLASIREKKSIKIKYEFFFKITSDAISRFMGGSEGSHRFFSNKNLRGE